MAEIELRVLRRRCLDRGIDYAEPLTLEVATREARRNAVKSKVNLRFNTVVARTSEGIVRVMRGVTEH